MSEPVSVRRTRAAAAALLTCAIAGCGSNRPRIPPAPTAMPEPLDHIHAVDVNPADRSLVIATHSGLFTVVRGSLLPRRLSARRQDTMALTVVGPNRFLGSGHPDARDDLPSRLGLILSKDGGRTWSGVSLEGRADFHVLRTAGRRIYGLTNDDGRLLVSDGAYRWTRRSLPARLVDVVPHPTRPDLLIASAEMMLFASADDGRSWRTVEKNRTGLLAWPRAHALYLVEPLGNVRASRNAGASWRSVGNVGGTPVAVAGDGRELYVALRDNSVKMSSDGGRTWRLRSRP